MVRLGIIGTGSWAHSHAHAFRAMRGVRVVACCDTVLSKAEAFARGHGISRVYTDYAEMLSAGDLHGVTIVTSDDAHAECAIAAARAGLHIFCEKPLATNLADARRMVSAVKRAAVVDVVNFTYRNSPALQKAAQVIERGGLGALRHVEASYLQSWLVSRVWGDWRTTRPLTWRLSSSHGSLGVLGDLGCHIYDVAAFLAGDIAEIRCTLKTFEKGVTGNRLGGYVLDANDSFVATVVFRNGALGTIHSTRWATGHVNSVRARVYGDRGAIEIDLDRSTTEYRASTGRRAIDTAQWKTVRCAPTPTNYQRFIRAIRTGRSDASDFANGLRIQRYLASSFDSSARCEPVRVPRG